jgi:hypothetical protein
MVGRSCDTQEKMNKKKKLKWEEERKWDSVRGCRCSCSHLFACNHHRSDWRCRRRSSFPFRSRCFFSLSPCIPLMHFTSLTSRYSSSLTPVSLSSSTWQQQRQHTFSLAPE